jgi:hypothetical protein
VKRIGSSPAWALWALGALYSGLALATPQDGLALQRMCQGADKVKALSVMCHSYLSGYLDTAATYEKGKAQFCVAEGDKGRMPGEIVSWLRLHPEAAKEPAPALLKKIMTERFPCPRGK